MAYFFRQVNKMYIIIPAKDLFKSVFKDGDSKKTDEY